MPTIGPVERVIGFVCLLVPVAVVVLIVRALWRSGDPS